MSRKRNNPPGVDPHLLIKDAAKLLPDPTRRLFLRGGASLGALAFLIGCDIVDSKASWTLEQLYALPQETQVTRHICVEGWSAIGKWTGVRFSEFLRRVGADTRAKYVWFRCAEASGAVYS